MGDDLFDHPDWNSFAFVKKFKNILTLAQIKEDPNLEGMIVRNQGSRLSIQPVLEKHFEYILKKMTEK